MNRLVILFGLILLFSSKTLKSQEEILGEWIFCGLKYNFYYNDSISGNYSQQDPIIWDFKENGELMIKKFGNTDTTFNWFIKSDLILSTGGLEYSIYSLSQNNLSLIDYSKDDTVWISFKRPKKINLNYRKVEIENILLSSIWSIDDTSSQAWEKHFEYFDNKTMVYRQKVFDSDLNDSAYHLLLDSWEVGQYNDYYFLYNIHNMMMGESMERFCQIIDINQTSYTILDFSEGKNRIRKFISLKNKFDNKEKLENLKGNWISKNTKDKTYGRYVLQNSKHWQTDLFEGELNLSIQEKTLSFKIDNLKPLEYTWKLGKDEKAIVLEHFNDEPFKEGIFFDCADILELTDTKLKILLFNNSYITGKKTPYKYLLNMIQEFEKKE